MKIDSDLRQCDEVDIAVHHHYHEDESAFFSTIRLRSYDGNMTMYFGSADAIKDFLTRLENAVKTPNIHIHP